MSLVRNQKYMVPSGSTVLLIKLENIRSLRKILDSLVHSPYPVTFREMWIIQHTAQYNNGICRFFTTADSDYDVLLVIFHRTYKQISFVWNGQKSAPL